jgi:ABC-type branched-subunit amino acid transport system ATPase component
MRKGWLFYTLNGGNGSEKTTLINIISDFSKPDGSSVELKEDKK